MATIYDVARRAEVSAATVSRVLNGHPSVDPQLAERVRAAVTELDYRPSALARNLRRSRTSLWAVIISDVGNPFFTSLVRGVEDVAQSSAYSVVLCNSDEDPAKEANYVSVALAEQVAGVILSPSGQPAVAARLLDAGTPLVLIDRELRDVRADSVLVDNEHGAVEAVAHLLANGYQRIGCITGPESVSTARRRIRGYQQALADDGSHYDDSLVRYGDFRETGGYQAMAELLDLPEPPDAVFVANNLMAVGALECLRVRGVTVPDQVGVVGFDDLPWPGLVRPALTTVSQPTYELGRVAAQLLSERIEDRDREPTTVVLKTELQVRGTSRRPE
ncbi:MAG TPA: LacI family DNA-binding transcriptional regulator [Micromonosporaceae bacterium]|jgi:LacI family transcriptional regulator|nr:LacI family DNA-binding transcriptional regulator [Micromonosporaceae bacterium]